jgi:hypothetical protein
MVDWSSTQANDPATIVNVTLIQAYVEGEIVTLKTSESDIKFRIASDIRDRNRKLWYPVTVRMEKIYTE